MLETRQIEDPPAPSAGVSAFCPRRVGVDGELLERECALPAGIEPLETEPEPEPPPLPEPKIDLEAVCREAFEQGAAEGERKGAAKAAQAHAQQIERLRGALDELLSYKNALRADAERELLELAFAVARRVVRRELTLDPQVALAIIRSCLKDFGGSQAQRIRVNERDVELVREHFGAPLEIEILADDKVSVGGAVIETDQGRLDARIETQLAEIESGLADGYA